jgi:hypothetical protein
MLRSVLVALDGSAYSETATALAIDWARRYDARLLGLGVVDAPSIQGAEPVPLGAGAYKQARDEAWLADAHRRVVNFLADFRARSEAADIAVEVLETSGTPRCVSCARRTGATWSSSPGRRVSTSRPRRSLTARSTRSCVVARGRLAGAEPPRRRVLDRQARRVGMWIVPWHGRRSRGRVAKRES